jgi:hypothetical protein
MNLQLRIVVADPLDGPPRAVYVGEDPIEADGTYEREAANEKNEAVHYFVYPTAARRCRPAYEAELRLSNEDRARREREASEEKRQAEIAAAKKRIEEAVAHLDSLEGSTESRPTEEAEAEPPQGGTPNPEPSVADAVVAAAAGVGAPRASRKRR